MTRFGRSRRDDGRAVVDEDQTKDIPGVRIVFDQEQMEAMEDRRVEFWRHKRANDGRVEDRQSHRAGRAPTNPGTIEGHAAAVLTHEVVHDGEAEPETSFGSARQRPALAEALKDVWEQRGIDARPGVADPDGRLVAVRLALDRD